ncbi:protein preY, mitochondrial-like [Myxocyprinus asiaticus]|uniref:protein preY, mitochondrial-like n=1 Tax=Myxocyprinus asiaticus TaxID=70543 RepID=UPI00222260F2|nr:protein preY, mitochondrial-like [Myxocyprinus asiaticus]
MSHYVLRRLVTGVLSVHRSVNYQPLLSARSSVKIQQSSWTDGLKDSQAFDVSILEFLVCPLSKKTLRYDEKNNQLINEELGIAYPIIDGIPNMIPQDARMIQKAEATEKPIES